MTDEKLEYAALDVEGPVVNPAADFAWQIYESLSKSTKSKFPRERCETYDGVYDDGRYFYELRQSSRHSTGMWPLASLVLAAIDGFSDEDLIAYAEKSVQENPGTEKLIESLMKNSGGKIYLITSSYPAIGLTIAKRNGIPFKQVFTHGYPHSMELLSQRGFEVEVRDRSPMSILSENKKELEKFMHKYMDICEALGKHCNSALDAENQLQEEIVWNEYAQIRGLRKQHDNLFEKIIGGDFRYTLKCMFLDESGVMGSHRKVDAMRKVHDNRNVWGFTGDGIVDGMPIDYAEFGIALNMTNKHALSLSKLNVATTNMAELIPVFDSMFNGEFEPKKIQDELNSEKIRVFTPRDIQEDINAAVKVNREKKNELKALYAVPKI